MRIPSRTPLHRSWCKTRKASISPTGGKTKENFSIGLNLHFTVGNEKWEVSSERATPWENLNNAGRIEICSGDLQVSTGITLFEYTKNFKTAVLFIPGVFDSLGIMHRTKWGAVDFRLVISLFKFSWNRHDKTQLALMVLWNSNCWFL